MNPEIQTKHGCALPLLALAVSLLLATVRSGSAQNFAVDRFVISGGGGTSTNGSLSLTGTIAQPDAGGQLVGGTLALDGGFWNAAVVIQMPGAPPLTLSLRKASGAYFFSWPLSGPNYLLESSASLGAAAVWTHVPVEIQTGSEYRFALLPIRPGQRFYRLRQIEVAP